MHLKYCLWRMKNSVHIPRNLKSHKKNKKLMLFESTRLSLKENFDYYNYSLQKSLNYFFHISDQQFSRSYRTKQGLQWGAPTNIKGVLRDWMRKGLKIGTRRTDATKKIIPNSSISFESFIACIISIEIIYWMI